MTQPPNHSPLEGESKKTSEAQADLMGGHNRHHTYKTRLTGEDSSKYIHTLNIQQKTGLRNEQNPLDKFD